MSRQLPRDAMHERHRALTPAVGFAAKLLMVRDVVETT